MVPARPNFVTQPDLGATNDLREASQRPRSKWLFFIVLRGLPI